MGKPELLPSEMLQPRISKAELIRQLSAILPPGALLHQDEDLKPFECDGLTAYQRMPLLVALPEYEEQVCAILRVCHEGRVPVVFRGAGTGLSGGALPYEHGLLLVMSKMKKILDIDARARTARVQPGVRNAAISEATAPLGLYYAPDPSSQIACSIGGNVAENSGGVHCLKYGLTVHNILKVRFVTIDGEMLEIGSEGLDSPGYDLLALITGSEGLLGVVTEITVKLLAKPEKAQVVLAAFDDIAKAAQAVGDVIAAGIIPAGLEMMDKLATQAVEQFVHAGYDLDAAALLLCESDGTAAEVDDEIARMKQVLAAAGATRLAVSRDEAERLRFWSGRKAAFGPE
jgi:glycolate oxidase